MWITEIIQNKNGWEWNRLNANKSAQIEKCFSCYVHQCWYCAEFAHFIDMVVDVYFVLACSWKLNRMKTDILPFYIIAQINKTYNEPDSVSAIRDLFNTISSLVCGWMFFLVVLFFWNHFISNKSDKIIDFILLLT